MISASRRSVVAGLAALATPGIGSRAFATGAAAYPALQAMLDGYVSSKRLPGGVVAVNRRGSANRLRRRRDLGLRHRRQGRAGQPLPASTR